MEQKFAVSLVRKACLTVEDIDGIMSCALDGGITAPLYWWKEADTYKVGTVANSCSTMHKIADKEFVESDFSTEHLFDFEDAGVEFPTIHGAEHTPIWALNMTIKMLNFYREKYLETKKKPMKEEAKRAPLMKS